MTYVYKTDLTSLFRVSVSLLLELILWSLFANLSTLFSSSANICIYLSMWSVEVQMILHFHAHRTFSWYGTWA